MPPLVEAIEKIAGPERFRHPDRDQRPCRHAAHGRDIGKGNGQGFVAEKFGCGPVQTKIDVLHEQVGGDEHIGFRVLRKHRAVVADPVEPELFLKVLDELELRPHFTLVAKTIVNTYNNAVLRTRHFNTSNLKLYGPCRRYHTGEDLLQDRGSLRSCWSAGPRAA